MKILFNTLVNDNTTGIDLKLSLRTLTNCTFKLSTIIADMPEASTYCLTYKSYNYKYPCFRCLTPLDKFNCIDSIANYEARTNQTMKNLYENNRCQEFSLISLYNIFWDFSDNIYKACVTDRIFGLANVTAAEYRDMMKIMPFVFYKLEKNNNDLSNVYANFTKMYIMSWSNGFTTSDLELFKLAHTGEVIKEFGSLNGYSTDTYETLHKFYVKNPYNHTNKRNTLKQISIMISRQNILKSIWKPKKKKNKNKNIIFTKIINNIKSNFMLDFNDKVIEKKVSILQESDENFYGKPYYSDAEITMIIEQSGDYLTEDGMCYGKCILLLDIMFIRNNEIEEIEMGIFQWYDYAANVNKPYYSDAEITMIIEQSGDYLTEDGMCYGKCILLLDIMFIRNNEIEEIEMGIFQWYDYAANVNKRFSKRNIRLLIRCEQKSHKST
ncbi:hypothetical protein Glove_64g5 [Diversispora epigaea]|uniref:Uncharacterized protein n=1 Tax=Diversispora epigaea TaxID=1348612 RepID=A0A397JEH5_9GLOM|nr:hypothetical protein Glove_64g5 [Diversispora epigaea]